MSSSQNVQVIYGARLEGGFLASSKDGVSGEGGFESHFTQYIFYRNKVVDSIKNMLRLKNTDNTNFSFVNAFFLIIKY